MPQQRPRLSRWIVRFGVLTASLLAFTYVLEQLGGMSGLWWHKIIELPLVLYLYFLLAQLLRKDPVGAVVAAVPIFLGYALMDLYYLLFGRVFRLSEVREVPELLDVLPWQISAALIAVAVIPALVFLWALRPQRPGRTVLTALPLVSLVGLIVLRPDVFLGGFTAAANGIVEWSDEENVRWNGRFTSILYQETRRRNALRSAAAHLDQPEYEQAFTDTVAALQSSARPRNIHVLVLEGFMDPGRLHNLKLNRDVLHPAFRALLRGGEGDLSTSPVFGGYTAQAEFEILCGVPALQVLGTIEYNLFSGARVHCLPDVLGQLGYRTLSSAGYKPNFFNKSVAERGLGFQESYFAREYAPQRPTYISTGDLSREKYMFDATLLGQNLELVREHLARSSDQPLFNYVLTIFGHYPYKLDESVRPRVVQAEAPDDKDVELNTLINQLYYRSQALAEHLERLMALDPEALVILVADHLPPLREGVAAYERLGYLGGAEDAHHRTLLAVLENGRPVPQGELHHYDVPKLVYGFITDGQYCDGDRCAQRSESRLRDEYMRVMAHAVAPPD